MVLLTRGEKDHPERRRSSPDLVADVWVVGAGFATARAVRTAIWPLPSHVHVLKTLSFQKLCTRQFPLLLIDVLSHHNRKKKNFYRKVELEILEIYWRYII